MAVSKDCIRQEPHQNPFPRGQNDPSQQHKPPQSVCIPFGETSQPHQQRTVQMMRENVIHRNGWAAFEEFGFGQRFMFLPSRAPMCHREIRVATNRGR